MYDFFSKDASKALDQVKEILYNRLSEIKVIFAVSVILDSEENDQKSTIKEEIEFLSNLLDKMERI